MFSKTVYPLVFFLCCTGLGVSVFYALWEPTADSVSKQVVGGLQTDTSRIDIGKQGT